MPSEITVVVADTAQTAAIRGGLPLSGRVMWFSEGALAAALDSIRMNHPKLIAVEAAFAERPQGRTFLSRVEELAIRGSAIRLVVRDNGQLGDDSVHGGAARNHGVAVRYRHCGRRTPGHRGAPAAGCCRADEGRQHTSRQSL
jgi:hypothetical protein